MREITGITNLWNTEQSMLTGLGSAVHASNKNKYEQLENDQECIRGIMSGKLPQLSRGQQES